MATKMTLIVQKTTDNTVVFQELKDESDPFAERRISGLYLRNGVCKDLGLSKETPRLQVTFEAVK